ncbi:hypothetical protein AKO1_000327, partial [Acrasis kona]
DVSDIFSFKSNDLHFDVVVGFLKDILKVAEVLQQIIALLMRISLIIYQEISYRLLKDAFVRQVFFISCCSRLRSLLVEHLLQSDVLYKSLVLLSQYLPSQEQVNNYKNAKINTIRYKKNKNLKLPFQLSDYAKTDELLRSDKSVVTFQTVETFLSSLDHDTKKRVRLDYDSFIESIHSARKVQNDLLTESVERSKAIKQVLEKSKEQSREHRKRNREQALKKKEEGDDKAEETPEPKKKKPKKKKKVEEVKQEDEKEQIKWFR